MKSHLLPRAATLAMSISNDMRYRLCQRKRSKVVLFTLAQGKITLLLYQRSDACSFSEPQVLETHSMVGGRTLGISPIAVFRFKYRSLRKSDEHSATVLELKISRGFEGTAPCPAHPDPCSTRGASSRDAYGGGEDRATHAL